MGGQICLRPVFVASMVRLVAVTVIALFTTRAVAKLGNQSSIDRMRRLQEPFPQACIDACPGATTFYEDLTALADGARNRLDLVCTHQDAIRCMSEGGEGFSACENIALNQGSPRAIEEVQCQCNFCSSVMELVLVSTETLDENERWGTGGERMPLQCLQVGLDACFENNPLPCAWAVDDFGFNELPTAEECDAEGHPTAQFDEPSGAQRAPLSFISMVAAFGVTIIL